MANFNFKLLCTPAKLYFALSVFSAIFMLYNRVNVIAVLVKVVFAFLWTVFLGWLCKKGYKNVSWGLVILPFVFMIFTGKGGYRSELLEGFEGSYVEGISPGNLKQGMSANNLRQGLDEEEEEVEGMKEVEGMDKPGDWSS